ncbi:PAS domain-containing protein [Polaribacter sargassicola]|uniref:PAS domain-containing protein n=1 Tax=Polaribacter sargassicola TaxID=2836891 RepID=UPI001F0276BC|nr:PAS domain-containing protein [Polaribacter sp. DS7-9]MCG1037734.1 PAS domain-containing protein [Polaribacter sp. DS7-9]
MDFNNILILFTQGSLIAFVILLLFKFRKSLGIGVLYASIGLFQFIQVIAFILNTNYGSFANEFLVLPGSSVFITITLFAFLIVYIKEDAIETKKMFYSILIVNILINLIFFAFFWNLNQTSSDNPLRITNSIFRNYSTYIVGNITLFLDVLLLITIFEFFSKKTRFLFLQILVTMLIVTSFDTVFFSTLVFWELESLSSILKQGIVSKGSFTFYYSLLFYLYLRYLDETDKDLLHFKVENVFKPLTYKQKFKTAVNNIKKANEMYRVLTDNSNDIICLQEPDSTFKYISPSIKKILGYEQSTFLGKKIFTIVHKDDLQNLIDSIDKKIYSNNKGINTITFRLLHKKGYYVWIEYNTSPIYNDKKITSFVTSARDITERVLATNQFKTSLELLKKREYTLNEASKIGKVGFLEYNTYTNNYIWSDYLYSIFGLKLTDKIPVGKEFLSFLDKDLRYKIITNLKTLKKEGKSFNIDGKAINNLKKEIWLKLIIEPVFNKENNIIGIRGIIQDFTDYKNTQLKIQNSLDLLKNKDEALNQSSKIAKIGFWDHYTETDNYIWSDYSYKIFGLKLKDKIPGRKEMIKLYDEESQKKIKAATLKILTNKEPYDIELKLTNFKNEIVWIRSIVHLIYNDKNEIIGRRGVIQDITESKKTQLELESSEFLLSEAGKLAKIGGWELNLKTNKIRWSDQVFKIHGLPVGKVPTVEEAIGFYIEGSEKVLEKAIKKCISENKEYNLILRFLNKQNKKLWVNAIGYPIVDITGKTIGLRGIIQDITDQKNIQIALDSQNEKLSKLNKELKEAQKISSLGNWEYNTITDKIIWSKELHNIFERPYKIGAPSYEEHKLLFKEESYILMNKAVQDCINNRTPYILELDINTTKGEIKHIIIRGKALTDKDNNVIGCYGTAQDITTLKNIQIELENKNKELNTSLKLLEESQYTKSESSKIAKIGYHEYNSINGTFYWSEYLYNIFGLDQNQKIPSREKLVSLFDEKSVTRLKKATENLETYGIPYDLELKLTNFKKEEIWIRMSNQALYDKHNKIIGRRGVAQDITERKKIEEENLKIKNDYIKLFDNATISIWNEDLTLLYKEIDKLKKLNINNIKLYLEENPNVLLNLTSKVQVNYVNKATLELFKAKNHHEFLQNIHLSFGRGAEKVFINLIEAIWNNTKNFTTEVNYKTLKGKEFTAILSVPIPQNIEEQKTVPVTIQSIQKIKNAELALKESLKELNEAQRIGRLGNWIANPITKEFIWSDEVFNIFGFDPKDGYPSFNELMNKIHPDDVDFHNKCLKDAEISGVPFDIELRIIVSKNEQKTIRVICETIKDKNGKVIKLKGVNQDITEHKKILLKLEETNKKIKQSLELLKISEHSRNEVSKIAKIGYQDYNSVTDTYTWSDYVYEVLGFNPINGIPKLEKVIKVFYRESQIKLLKAFEEIEKRGTPFDLELKLFDKQKGYVWIRYVGQPIFNDNNEIIGRRGIIQNITDQTIKQNKLDQQNDKLFNLNHALNEAQSISKVGNWKYINTKEYFTWSKELYNIFERSPALGPPRNYSEYISYFTEESSYILQKAIEDCFINKLSFNIQLDIYSSNGSLKHVTIRGKVLYDKNNIAIGCYGTTQDITEQRQILDEIKRTQELYRLVTENSTDIICLLYRDTTLKYASPSAKNLLDYNIEDYLDKQVFDIIHKDDIKLLKEKINYRKISNNYDSAFTLRVRHKKGHYIWMEALSSPVYVDNQINYFVISARNVTSMMLAKQEIQEYQNSLQKLTTEITLIEEKQKREIATNIHDHLSQSLVISKMKINALKKNPQLKIINDDLQFIDTHISDALSNSRKITYDLSPPVLYQLGIVEALNWLLNDVESKHKIKCIFNDYVNEITLNDTKSILLFRSIQEVLNNTIKYAKASIITLDINKNKAGLKIIISDNGIGFDTNVLKKHNKHTDSGFGLFTVKERIKNINGEIIISSIINKGTTVNIFIPL